jgi:pimeloyl-ACP methyl ester carboxylesterase
VVVVARPRNGGRRHGLLGTIVQDNQRGKPLPATRWANVTAPTLVMDGGKSPIWMRNAMRALADVLPNATHRTLEGQTHMVEANAHVPVLVEFFKS